MKYPHFCYQKIITCTVLPCIIKSNNHSIKIKFLRTSLSSSVQDGSSSSTALTSGFSGSLDSSTCSSTFSCLVRRAISCDFKPLELRARQSSSLRRSFTYKETKQGEEKNAFNLDKKRGCAIGYNWMIPVSRPTDLYTWHGTGIQETFTCFSSVFHGQFSCTFNDQCCDFFLESYLHWFRVKFSPVSGSTNVLWFIIILVLFLLDRKSLR